MMDAAHPWTEKEWRARRDDFLAEGGSAPDILEWRKTKNSLDQEVERTRRYIAVEHLMACCGLGKHDDPKGRRAAYLEAILPFDFKDKPGLDNRTSQIALGCPQNSSCGTFIRAAWQLFGAGDMSLFPELSGTKMDPNFRCSYKADAFVAIAKWGKNCGALHGDYLMDDQKTPIKGIPLTESDPTAWKGGDVVFVRRSSDSAQHIFNVVDSTRQPADKVHTDGSWAVNTIDGGKGIVDSDSVCMGIRAANRTVYVKRLGPTPQIMVNLIGGDYAVAWWVDFGKVRFSDPEYFFARRGPNHPKVKPASWENKISGGY